MFWLEGAERELEDLQVKNEQLTKDLQFTEDGKRALAPHGI